MPTQAVEPKKKDKKAKKEKKDKKEKKEKKEKKDKKDKKDKKQKKKKDKGPGDFLEPGTAPRGRELTKIMEEDEAEEAGSIYVKSGVQGFRNSGISIGSTDDRRSSISDILNS